MNDQHPHAGYPAYDGYQNGSFEADPLFGTLPDGQYDTGPAGHSGQYDSTQWDIGAPHQATGYDGYGTPQYEAEGLWATVTTVTTSDTGYQQPAVGHGPAAEPEATGPWNPDVWNQTDPLNGAGGTGGFDASRFGYDTPGQTATATFDPARTTRPDSEQFDVTQFEASQFETSQFDAEQFRTAPFGYDETAQWAAPSPDSGAYDATAWNPAGAASAPEVPDAPGREDPYQPESSYEYEYGAAYGAPGPEPERTFDAEYDHDGGYEAGPGTGAEAAPENEAGTTESGAGTDGETNGETEVVSGPEARSEDDTIQSAKTSAGPAITAAPRPVRRAGSGGSSGRGRRRTAAKRSALLTVAVPSACVMGVAGIAAASVGGLGTGEKTKDDSTTTASAADAGAVKPAAAAAAANNKLDTQLAALSEDARDFGDRASRTQERIDLQARQEADKKKRAQDAARKEAARPKFALPVSQHGLSAYYGQAGVNWMSVHTGIDFPVSYGTPVMAATDGTVRTQYNSAYGNMAIVTSPDGTETWYCHLSSTKIRSGSVKAGDVIAYSGSSGNSTGPHLHFEVRPGAGAAIDPLSWLRSHGIDPT